MRETRLSSQQPRMPVMALGPVADESLRVTTVGGREGRYFGISSSGKLLNFDFLILKISKTLSSRVL